MRRDYYAVLGVASTAGLREVRQAYRRLARQYSPDVNFWDAQARGLFDEIEEAYRVLSDAAARAMYDRFGHALRDGEALAAGRRPWARRRWWSLRGPRGDRSFASGARGCRSCRARGSGIST